jgi:HSP20 family protein
MLEILRKPLDGEPAAWRPSVDVHERDGDLVLTADLPDLQMGELQVTVEDGALILDADGWDDSEPGHEHYEHVHGRLMLPFAVDPSRIEAHPLGDALEIRVHVPTAPPAEAAHPEAISD